MAFAAAPPSGQGPAHGDSHRSASASDRGRSGNNRWNISPSERPSGPGAEQRPASLGIHSRGRPAADMTHARPLRAFIAERRRETTSHSRLHVPPLWFRTTSTACSAHGQQVYCNPQPARVHRVSARQRPKSRLRIPAMLDPSKNSPRWQLCRITAAMPSCRYHTSLVAHRDVRPRTCHRGAADHLRDERGRNPIDAVP